MASQKVGSRICLTEAVLVTLDAVKADLDKFPEHYLESLSDIIHVLNAVQPANLADVFKQSKIDLAVDLYRREELAFGRACKLADMDMHSFRKLLGDRGVNTHYGVEEYREDLATLEKLGFL